MTSSVRWIKIYAMDSVSEFNDYPKNHEIDNSLEVDYLFDWSWQPDRLQQPKHYIFHARNPVNNLEYGHQAMIAYNKKLVLENCFCAEVTLVDSNP